jgi:hypothetical protein
MLPGEVDPALRTDDVGLLLGLLLGREQSEGAVRPAVVLTVRTGVIVL